MSIFLVFSFWGPNYPEKVGTPNWIPVIQRVSYWILAGFTQKNQVLGTRLGDCYDISIFLGFLLLGPE